MSFDPLDEKCPIELVDAELRAAGCNPEQLAREGAELARRLEEKHAEIEDCRKAFGEGDTARGVAVAAGKLRLVKPEEIPALMAKLATLKPLP